MPVSPLLGRLRWEDSQVQGQTKKGKTLSHKVGEQSLLIPCPAQVHTKTRVGSPKASYSSLLYFCWAHLTQQLSEVSSLPSFCTDWNCWLMALWFQGLEGLPYSYNAKSLPQRVVSLVALILVMPPTMLSGFLQHTLKSRQRHMAHIITEEEKSHGSLFPRWRPCKAGHVAQSTSKTLRTKEANGIILSPSPKT